MQGTDIPAGLRHQAEQAAPGQVITGPENKNAGLADLLTMAQQAQRIGRETAQHLLEASQYPGTEAARAHVAMALRAQQSMMQVIEAELSKLD